MSLERKSRPEGFSLIELLVVVVIIGIIAAIGIPTLLNAIDRGKQKRTMADIRTVATAVESYCVDNNLYPNTTDWIQMTGAIQGDYLSKVKSRDGWGNTLLYASDGLDYTIGSTGKDGGGSLVVSGSGGPTGSFNDDIVYSNGNFVQWPEGEQAD